MSNEATDGTTASQTDAATPADRDLYDTLIEADTYFVITEDGPKDGDIVPRQVRGVMHVVQPRGRGGMYHYTLQGTDSAGTLDFRKVPQSRPSMQITRISPSDFSLAITQLSRDAKALVWHIGKPFGQIDPGWVELFMGNSVFGAVDSKTGWPTWTEWWYLPSGKSDLGTFTNGIVYDKGTNYPTPPAPIVKWKHVVDALTGTYESEGATNGKAFLVKSNQTLVAVIHQVPNGTDKYIDTWWLVSNFTWWGSVAQIPIEVSSVEWSVAQTARNGFSPTVRYKHTINKF